MIHDLSFVGIDVSKHHFDVHIHPAGESLRCGTSSDAIAQLVRRIAGLGPVAVGLEASGGYESRLADSLHAAGVEAHVVAPARVRSFARGIGQLAKTDRIDAAMIARYLVAVRADLTPYAPDRDRRRLSAISAHRRRLLAEKSGLISQLDTIDEPLVRSMIETRLATIAQDIATLDAAITDLLAKVARLRQCHARLRKVTGVGPVLATALLADMPELGKVSAKVCRSPCRCRALCAPVGHLRAKRALCRRAKTPARHRLHGRPQCRQGQGSRPRRLLSRAQGARQTLQARYGRNHAKAHHNPQCYRSIRPRIRITMPTVA
ncbi:transposase [Shinella kummerowiae]|nr:transposase [Shinella kummerowiae]MCT7666858.1 transposase [Shinella kummerowiae]